jgi:hypothetical protein
MRTWLVLAACAGTAPPPAPVTNAAGPRPLGEADTARALCQLLGAPVASLRIPDVAGHVLDDHRRFVGPGPYRELVVVDVRDRVVRVEIVLDAFSPALATAMCQRLDRPGLVPMVLGEHRVCGWEMFDHEVEVVGSGAAPIKLVCQ